MLTVSLPRIYGMLENVPEDDRPKDSELARFWLDVADELANLMHYSIHAYEPEIVLSEVRQAGSQYIWEFWVNDLAKARTNDMNWHGQNTSQWVYAGCILLQNGKVSTHH